MNKQYVKRMMYIGGGIGNAQFSTELVGWNISCKIRILTQDIKFVGELIWTLIILNQHVSYMIKSKN